MVRLSLLASGHLWLYGFLADIGAFEGFQGHFFAEVSRGGSDEGGVGNQCDDLFQGVGLVTVWNG
jgi:hypothetical protein